MDSFKNLTREEQERILGQRYRRAQVAMHVERQPILEDWPMKGLAKVRKVTIAELKRLGY